MTTQEASKIMEVSLTSISEDGIIQSFRRKAKLLHPDRHPNATEEQKEQFEASLKEVLKAKEVLLTYLITPKDEPKVKSNFGTQRKHRRKRALDPRDVFVYLSVTVKELHKGIEQPFVYQRRKVCEACHGKGCYLCTGEVRMEELKVACWIHSTLMNDKQQIIYSGLGDITYEAADLVIVLDIVEDQFNLEDSNGYPVVTSTRTIRLN